MKYRVHDQSIRLLKEIVIDLVKQNKMKMKVKKLHVQIHLSMQQFKGTDQPKLKKKKMRKKKIDIDQSIQVSKEADLRPLKNLLLKQQLLGNILGVHF